jgi:mycothiol synthase
MKTERLNMHCTKDFIAYCIKHRNEVDDSFLYDHHLEKFKADDENPTFVVKDENRIIAAASLIMDEYYKNGGSGRFRIFHSEINEIAIYSALLQEVLKEANELKKVSIFIPFVNKELAENIEKLHFTIERYIFLLVNDMKEISEIKLPEGYSIRALESSDLKDWCIIRNEAFAQLKGNLAPITPEMVQKNMAQPEYLEGGHMLMLKDDKPVGIIRGENDEYEGTPAMYIGPIAVLPAYQGKGLGRQLLRAALHFADNLEYKKAVLCVNADNEKAKELYLQEGFKQTEGVTAYELCL